MSLSDEWALAYARQAKHDFTAWKLYQEHPQAKAAECHALLFLQMACEKLCKAHLIRQGADPSDLQSSHGYIAKPLPVIIRQEASLTQANRSHTATLIPLVKQLAGEIELLNPSVERDGRRKDNCEYPWESGDRIYSPLDHTFAPSGLLTARAGRTFLKLLELAINRNLAG